MKDVEELLLRDRAAGGLPELPDPRYTAAVVRRHLGRPPAPAAADSESGGLVVLGGLAGAAAMGLAALAFGLGPWWLLAVPLLALPLWPIILRKGA